MADIVSLLVPVGILIFILSGIVMILSAFIAYFSKDSTTRNNAEDVFSVSGGITGFMLFVFVMIGIFSAMY